MKFVCPKCSARYTLAEDKVPATVALRFTCKRCGNVIRLRRPTAAAGAGEGEDSAAERVAPIAEPAETNGEEAASGGEWLVLIGREQKGPFSGEELGAMLARGEIDERSFVWREGMPEWLRFATVPELHDGAAALDADSFVAPPSPVDPEPENAEAGASAAYQNAPPGEATRVFMATAGLDRRRRNQRMAAIAAAAGVAGVVTVVALDTLGVYTLPYMGAMYDFTGVRDPNVGRAVARVESRLHDSSLTLKERDALRAKLLGLHGEQAGRGAKAAAGAPGRVVTAIPPAATTTQAIAQTSRKGAGAQALAAALYADDRKKEAGVRLVDPAEIQTPNLPNGLTQEAILKVVSDNTRSMKLCLEEAFKKGDHASGKMEVEITIAPDGAVTAARVTTPQFRGSQVASCTIRRVKGWRFPRFSGEPVTVIFPYVLSAGF